MRLNKKLLKNYKRSVTRQTISPRNSDEQRKDGKVGRGKYWRSDTEIAKCTCHFTVSNERILTVMAENWLDEVDLAEPVAWPLFSCKESK